MSDSPQDFDLKFLPDWLKEGPSTNRYADFEGESDRPRRDRDDRGPRPPGRGGPQDRRGPRPSGDRRPGPGGPRPPRGPEQRGGGPRPDRPPGGPRREDRRDDRRGGGRAFESRGNEPRREAPRPAPAELRIEFIPEPNAGAGIARQIKASNRAYAVFATAKLFLERPERHRVRITSQKPDVLLYQVGDGPVTFDATVVERGAFLHARADYYTEETVQGEPIKGNFTNVARVRGTSVLLGPTNHHSYQPTLRKVYEERFSRRMSFQDFVQYEIEVVSDEQAVADWKEQARSSTTYTTKNEAEPLTFKTLFDAEQHFRKTYLPGLLKSGTTLECSGPASRSGADRHVSHAVRIAWEAERAFPQGLVNTLRPYFNEVGLHFFKHRKRVLHVSAIKPLRHPQNQPFSDGVTSILKAVEGQPRIKRPQLAIKILGPTPAEETPEFSAKKEQLAADLHYLLHTGYVIEFADGAFDLPLAPKSDQPPAGKAKPTDPAPAMAEEESADETEPPLAVDSADSETAPSATEPSIPGNEPGEPAPIESVESIVEPLSESEPLPASTLAPTGAGSTPS